MSAHTELVWAPENTSWSGGHMSQAAITLARLTEIEPEPDSRHHPRARGGAWPGLFGLNGPQTSLPSGRRLVVLDTLRRRYTDAAWLVMRAILPTHLGCGSSSPSHRPQWRQWAQDQPRSITYAELHVRVPEESRPESLGVL